MDVRGKIHVGSSDDYVMIGHINYKPFIESFGGDLYINPQNNKDVHICGTLKVGDKMKITQNGRIWGQEFKVKLSDPYPDYVFKKDYNLMSLEDLKHFIENNGHLPGILSEKEVENAEGIELGHFCLSLLEKIEELTQYTIQQEEKIRELESKLNK